MSGFGILRVNNLEIESVLPVVNKLLEEKGKESVDEESDFSEWYEGSSNLININNTIITKYLPLFYYTRKKVEDIDKLTERVYVHFITKSKRISFIETKFLNENKEMLIIFEKGTIYQTTNLTNLLGLNITARKRQSFSEDFIEFLNTAQIGEKGYKEIFGDDMESRIRKGKEKTRHYIIEGYEDIHDREKSIKVPLREAAGVKITPHMNFLNIIPTIELIIFKNNYLDILRPRLEDGENVFYTALIYGYKRLINAFNEFEKIMKY